MNIVANRIPGIANTTFIPSASVSGVSHPPLPNNRININPAMTGETALAFSPTHPGFAAHAWHLLADVAAQPEGLDAGRAESAYRRALGLAEARAMRPLVAHCHLGLGRLARIAGRAREAKEHLSAAATMYRAMAMDSWSRRAEEETGPAASLL